jgi:hypothetical protein
MVDIYALSKNGIDLITGSPTKILELKVSDANYIFYNLQQTA